MEDISATASSEDYIDISALRFLDLRSLGQDEIRCLAHLCGDVPARLQDLVNVIVDKSMFNESAGSRRQTFDRDRLPRNKERRLSTGSASAQLHLAIESAGLSHKDLILHLCRQLNIEKGDRAMYQPQGSQPSGAVAEGNRPMSLKRMARASASFAGRADSATVPVSKAASELLVNGKEVAMPVLHRSSKKMKTKEEARRRAAESQQAGAVVRHELQEDKHALVADKSTSSRTDEGVLRKNVPSGGINSPAQIQKDLRSPEVGIAGAFGPKIEAPKLLNLTSESLVGRPKKRMKHLCRSCERSFANEYSLRRHTASTGHISDMQLVRTGIASKKKKKILKNSLQCSCGNTYATSFTLRRHAVTTGHSLKTSQTSTSGVTIPSNDPGEERDDNVGLKLEKQKLAVFSAEAAWKSSIRRFSCRYCHRQFIRKKHFIHHMDTHFKRARKKIGKGSHQLLKGQSAASSNDEVKVRLGRPPKLDPTVPSIKKRGRPKRQLEAESVERRVKSRKAEGGARQTPGHIPSQKAQTLTCQECGKVFNEFSRYTGHLSMHARTKRPLVGETSSSAILRKNMLKFKELTALGFRKLLSDKTGTYLPGLPAKLLFSESDLANKRNGKL